MKETRAHARVDDMPSTSTLTALPLAARVRARSSVLPLRGKHGKRRPPVVAGGREGRRCTRVVWWWVVYPPGTPPTTLHPGYTSPHPSHGGTGVRSSGVRGLSPRTSWGSGSGRPPRPRGRGGRVAAPSPVTTSPASRRTAPAGCSREGVWIALGSNDHRTALRAVRPGSGIQDPGPRTRDPGSLTQGSMTPRIPDPRIPGSQTRDPMTQDPRTPGIRDLSTGLDVDPEQCWPALRASTSGHSGHNGQNPR